MRFICRPESDLLRRSVCSLTSRHEADSCDYGTETNALTIGRTRESTAGNANEQKAEMIIREEGMSDGAETEGNSLHQGSMNQHCLVW